MPRSTLRRLTIPACTGLTLTGALALGLAGPAPASSHSDAPLIKQDPQANLTDVYAFLGTRYDDPSATVLNVIANVRPFSEPGDGPHYDRFADDALYSLHITNPMSGETMMRYDFQFSRVDQGLQNRQTILSYGSLAGPIVTLGDGAQNFQQTYRVSRQQGGSTAAVGGDLPVNVPNAGSNVTPSYNDADGRAVSGAADFASLDTYTQQAVRPLPSGEVVFAGPRDDSFFADIPGVFNLLDVRILDNNGTLADGLGQDGEGVDGFKGFNVLSFGIQIPLDMLEQSGIPSGFESVFFGPQTGVDVYASVSRRQIRMINEQGRRTGAGPWIQVNRLGNPLFNEGLVALRDKDRYNRVSPLTDAAFATYAAKPELAALINSLYGTSFVEADRADLVNIFIPDVLRVATTTGPVPLEADEAFSRLGFLEGDTTGGVSSGWPNGRRFGDDVVDIALTAIASGPAYETVTLVGDNVADNDISYHQVFPYAATPHSGSFNRKDPR